MAWKKKLGRPRREVDESVLIKRYVSGESSTKLSREFGISVDAVLRIIRRNGYSIRKGGRRKLDLPIKEIVDKYCSGKKVDEIAEEYGVCREVVRLRLVEANVELQGIRKSTVLNEDFFSKIDSEEKAYWLGFLFADGNVSKKNYTIQLSLKDHEHVRKFASSMGYKGGFWYHGGCVSISFKSKKMWVDLNNLGLIPQKSKFLKVLPEFKGGLEVAFWRGFFDGDGCISGGEIKLSNCCKFVCSKFLEFLSKKLGVGDVGVILWGSGCWEAKLYGVNARRALYVLYNNANVFLERKYKLGSKRWLRFVDDGVCYVGQSITRKFLMKYHYLKSLPPGTICYGLFVDKELCGVAAFGLPTSVAAAKSIYGKYFNKVFELRRFALKPGTGKNTASFFLSRALKLLNKRKPNLWAVLSYADPNVGHFGTIYQACNFFYIGETKSSIVAVLNGNRICERSIKNLPVEKLSKAVVKVERGKYRYIYIFGNKKEREFRKGFLRVEIKKYPKDTKDNHN